MAEKERGRVCDGAAAAGLLVCGACFVAEKSAVHTASQHQNGELSLFSDQ